MESFSERIHRQYEERRKEAMENKSNIDVHFIELYVKKMYGEDLSTYYLVTPAITSRWRNSRRSFPESRIHEFTYREGSSNSTELMKRIYK